LRERKLFREDQQRDRVVLAVMIAHASPSRIIPTPEGAGYRRRGLKPPSATLTHRRKAGATRNGVMPSTTLLIAKTNTRS
jgi:hypothetical protein